MQRIRTIEAPQHLGQQVQICGWLHAVRNLGRITFLVIRDGFGTIQVVVPPGSDNPIASSDALVESVVCVGGELREEPRAPGGVELGASRIELVSAVEEPVPVPINKPALEATLPVMLDHAPVCLRQPKRRALFRLSAGVMAGFRRALTERGFTEIQTPKLVASATEGGANVFPVEYFGETAYLAQSPQFYKQTMVGVFERVFEVGPVFRAEPHATARHVNEYVSLDVEFGFIEDHTTVMALLNEVIAGIMAHLEAHHGGELATLELELPEVPESIPRVEFRRAKELCFERTGEDRREEPDLTPSEERCLGRWAGEEHGSAFVFVTGYPLAKRPFYTHPNPEEPECSNSFDLLFRGTELVTGGQRLHRYADYLEALDARGMAHEPFASYLEAFRYGMPPHGGFAIGLERFLMQLTGAKNLKEVTLFPRDTNRLTP